MRCGCPNCGTYMIQEERGLESACVCPACAHRCTACLGTEQAPMTIEQLRGQARLLEELRSEERANFED